MTDRPREFGDFKGVGLDTLRQNFRLKDGMLTFRANIYEPLDMEWI